MRGLWVVVVALSSACSALYDSADYFAGSGLDVEFRLSAAPYEGATSLIVIAEGSGIGPDAVFATELEGAELGDTLVADDGSRAAATLRLPVLPDLFEGQTRAVAIALAQPDDARVIEDTLQVEVIGLDELVVDGEEGCACPPEPLDCTLCVIDTDQTRPLYSEIRLEPNKGGEQGLAFMGEAPGRLMATGRVHLDGQLVSGTRYGPGACAGGEPGQSAPCGAFGGKAPAPSASGRGQPGGGGGYATSGLSSIDAGQASGNRWLVPLAEQRPGGGGGGGGVTAGALAGGAGGDSGGVLHIGGASISGSFQVTAAGSPGQLAAACVGQGNPADLGGPGGGGAGGGVWLSARERFDAGHFSGQGSPEPFILVSGGDGGGITPFIEGCPFAASGSDGRIRIDAPSIDELLDTDPAAARGPAFVEPVRVTHDANEVMTVVADTGIYRVTVNGEARPPLVSSTVGQFSPRLAPGLNEVCVIVDDSLVADEVGSRECIAVAYVPR